MAIKGEFREVKFTNENANGDIIDTYYQIPLHDNEEDNSHQLQKQILIHKGIITYSSSSGEE
tara:strand:+ start:114 stop:299 length:186 start_codon:yes stop_codon:yes gene_type:complete